VCAIRRFSRIILDHNTHKKASGGDGKNTYNMEVSDVRKFIPEAANQAENNSDYASVGY